MQLTGIILILMSILGKIGAAFCMIPEPIIGGLGTMSLGTIFGESTSIGYAMMSGIYFKHSCCKQLYSFIIGNSFLSHLMISHCLMIYFYDVF